MQGFWKVRGPGYPIRIQIMSCVFLRLSVHPALLLEGSGQLTDTTKMEKQENVNKLHKDYKLRPIRFA